LFVNSLVVQGVIGAHVSGAFTSRLFVNRHSVSVTEWHVVNQWDSR
jgi:hypothetical protein